MEKEKTVIKTIERTITIIGSYKDILEKMSCKWLNLVEWQYHYSTYSGNETMEETPITINRDFIIEISPYR